MEEWKWFENKEHLSYVISPPKKGSLKVNNRHPVKTEEKKQIESMNSDGLLPKRLFQWPMTRKTRPSRPIRCAVWIVERMRYRPTDRPTDTASYRGALSHLKTESVYSGLSQRLNWQFFLFMSWILSYLGTNYLVKRVWCGRRVYAYSDLAGHVVDGLSVCQRWLLMGG